MWGYIYLAKSGQIKPMRSCGFLVQDVHGGTADLKHEKPPDKFVIISVPGDHSRKPPLGCIQNLEVFSLSLSLSLSLCVVVLVLFVMISQS